MPVAMRVGVLALQGCVDPHFKHLSNLGIKSLKVKTLSDLETVNRLILPGGESTTMLRLLHSTGLYSGIIKFAQSNPVWGICAGAILIAKEVSHPEQDSLGLIDIHAHRNHYGSQLDSFESELMVQPLNKKMMVQFIRAPLLTPTSESIKVLASHKESPVLMQQNRVLVSSFHVELGEDSSLHEYFTNI